MKLLLLHHTYHNENLKKTYRKNAHFVKKKNFHSEVLFYQMKLILILNDILSAIISIESDSAVTVGYAIKLQFIAASKTN